ncbi:MAG: hypothetical protein QGG40_20815, partial [Myxococcota bacterium]|nr:hypothetical protein [Myxococcota bacterium]
MAVMWWFRGPSPHFTWKELSTTDTGLANWPISPHARLWLTKLTWGILELPGKSRELSMYASEGYYEGSDSRLRRFSYRTDGFVSARGGPKGG